MTEKRFTAIRKKNPISKYTGNYIQDNGTTVLKLGYFTDCNDVCDLLNELSEENEQLKSELKGMEELLKSYRKTIAHDAELLADATKNGYLPPLGE